MENVNLSKLRMLYIMYGAIGLFSLLSFLVPDNLLLSTVFAVVVQLLCMGIIGWGTIGGKGMGVNLAGRIGGWIYLGLMLVSLILIVVRNYFFHYYVDSYSTFTILNIIVLAINAFILIALSLFALCSKVWLPLKLAVVILVWLRFLWNILASYVLGELLGMMQSYESYMISNIIIELLVSGTILTLALVWRPCGVASGSAD